MNTGDLYDHFNIFAKILRQELPCNKVYEDEYILAFHDIAPAAPTHVLVIPKREYKNYGDFISNAKDSEIVHFFTGVQKVITTLKLTQQQGYRIVSNCGINGGQLVEHFHLHILAGKNLGAICSS